MRGSIFVGPVHKFKSLVESTKTKKRVGEYQKERDKRWGKTNMLQEKM